MSVPAPVGSPTVSVGSAATSRSGTFDFTSRSSSFDITSMRDEILPTQCYICQAKFSPTVHSVLQLCDCRVGICQQCALNNMTLNEDLSLDCQICGSKVNSGTNTGIIRNVTKVRQLTDKYLDRGFKFYGLHAPPKKDPTISHYYPLVLKYGKEANLQPHVVDFLRAETTDSAEPGTQTRDRKKLNVHYLKLVLARVEHLRAGPLTDETFEVGNLSLPEGDLPLGPLAALSLTRNVFLEKILSGQELEAACKTCGEHIHQGESILFSCDCESLLCHGCAINGFVESKYTYRKGVCCPVCKRNSMISLGSLEKAKEEEGAIIELMVKKYAPEGAHYTAKSIQDLRKLLEHLYALGLASHVRTHEEVHALSFQQVELEIARIYVALERKKSRHDKLVKKDKKHAIYRKTHAQGDVKEAEEGDKAAKKAEKKKGEKEPEQLPAEHVVTYESKEDETYLHSASELDAGFDLPIGPMRLFKFSRNPYVEMYLYSTYGEIEPEEQGLADFMKMFRFNPYKPKFNTCCPRCSINPQNAEYLKRHLKTVHNVSRKDEVDKIMKGVTIEPVALDFPAAVDAAPPAPAGYNLFGQKA